MDQPRVWTTGTHIERPNDKVSPDAPNRQHPKDGAFKGLNGRTRKPIAYRDDLPAAKTERIIIKEVDGENVTLVGLVRGEKIVKHRKTNESSRSKAARVEASGKAQIFVKAQRDTDRRLDAPTPLPESPNPGPREWVATPYRRRAVRRNP